MAPKDTKMLQEVREAVVRRHFEAENSGDVEGVLATFGGTPRYEMVHLGVTHEGDEAVRAMLGRLVGGFPDLHAEPGRLRHLEDAVFVECVTTGTHEGPFIGIPPTGKRIEVRTACVFEFEGDQLERERVYLDFAGLLRQIGGLPGPPPFPVAATASALDETEPADAEADGDGARPLFTPYEDTTSMHVDALGIRYLVMGDQTDGALAAVDIPCKPRSVIAPTHVHTNEDEYQIVLEGELGFEIGKDVYTAKAGDMIVQPRGVPLAIWNPAETTARLLVMITPAEYAEYLKQVAPLIAAGKVQEMFPLWQRYGLRSDPSSIARLVRDYGLEPPS